VNDNFDTPSGKLSDLDALCARQRLARDHAAFFPTRLALARWRGGCTLPPVRSAVSSPRADWFDRVQRDHQAWLDRGGFAQHEELAPLRQPTMWQPPVAAPGLAPGAAHDGSNPLLAQARPIQDGDARQCGACN